VWGDSLRKDSRVLDHCPNLGVKEVQLTHVSLPAAFIEAISGLNDPLLYLT
jgi:hypothetical protein